MNIETRCGLLPLTLLVAACAITPDMNRLTTSQQERVASVEILYGETDKPFRSLGHLRAQGCQKSNFNVNVPENDAIRNLKVQAASVNADAIITTECRRANIDWFTNCFMLVECTGEAIQFAEK